MRKVFYGSIVMLECMALFGATIEPGDSSKRHKTDYVTYWTPQETQTYTVSASASGCSFVDSKTKASGGAILKSHSSSSASAEKNIEHTETPNASAFGFSVSGVLAGSGNGGEVTWSVTLQQKFFWLTVAPSIIVKAGTAITVTANGAPTESKWNINNKEWKDWTALNSELYKASSITLNRNMWDKMKWTPEKPHSTFEAPTAGKHSVSATTTETTGARSASIDVHVVEITKPAKNGDPSKWENNTMKYDCQVLKTASVVSLQPAITISGNWAGIERGEWKVSRGIIGDANKASTTFRNFEASKGVTLGLYFTETGNQAIDERNIDVFEDYLELGYNNFGTGRSCKIGWKPKAKYGISAEEIPAVATTWNCHGSTVYFHNGSTAGFSNDISQIESNYSLQEIKIISKKGDTVSFSSLLRGDVIAYYDSAGHIMHSQTMYTPQTSYGANNEPLTYPGTPGDCESYKWATSAAGMWTSQLDISGYYPVTIKVYRKVN